MAGKTRKRTAKIVPVEKTIRNCIVEGVARLLHRYSGDLKKIREESEQQIAVFSFSCKVDCSEAEPQVKTQIRFASSTTDSVTARLDDPNQGNFEFLDTTTGNKESENPDAEDPDTAPERN